MTPQMLRALALYAFAQQQPDGWLHDAAELAALHQKSPLRAFLAMSGVPSEYMHSFMLELRVNFEIESDWMRHVEGYRMPLSIEEVFGR